MSKAAAPDFLLKMIFCNCKVGGCETGRCKCKKAGLSFTDVCGFCDSERCSNKINFQYVKCTAEEDSEDEEAPSSCVFSSVEEGI